MTPRDVFLEAARRIYDAELEFACSAVKWSGGGGRDGAKLSLWYADLFMPEDASVISAWGNRWGRSKKARRECRTFSLCLMAAIADNR